MTEPLKATDSVTFQELASLYHIPVEFVIATIETQRRSKPFHSIRDLAARWRCSTSSVYNIVDKCDVKTLHFGFGKKRGVRLISAESVERIEHRFSKFMKC
jgi:hypothetical protein